MDSRLEERAAGVRGGDAHDLGGRADADDAAAGLAALGTQIDDPIGGAHHIQIVLDDQQRVAGLDQPPEGAQQFRDVVEVQAGGRFVEQKQRALAGCGVGRGARGLFRRALADGIQPHGVLGEMPGELEALRLAARQGRHGLTQPQIIEAHFRERRQAQANLGVGGEKCQRFGDREIEHIGDALGRRSRRGTVSPRALRRDSGGRRNRGSAGTRPRGIASRRVRSRCRRMPDSGRCRH